MVYTFRKRRSLLPHFSALMNNSLSLLGAWPRIRLHKSTGLASGISFLGDQE